jgi:hypothetical protein
MTDQQLQVAVFVLKILAAILAGLVAGSLLRQWL